MTDPKPRRKRPSPMTDHYAQEATRFGRSSKTIRNGASLAAGLEYAVGPEALDTIANSKLGTARAVAALIRLRRTHDQDTVLAFAMKHIETGLPDWIAAPSDTPMGLVMRGLERVTAAERARIRDVLIDWCDRETSHARDAKSD